MNIKPLGNRIIVEVVESATQTPSGIHLPESARDVPQRGIVMAVGPGLRDKQGGRVPMDVVVGDEVFWPRYGAVEVRGDDKLMVVSGADVLVKVEGS